MPRQRRRRQVEDQDVPRRGPGRRTVFVAGALAVALGVVAVAGPSAFVVEGPGPAVDTLGSYEGTRLITISGHRTYPSDSRLDLTTVSVAGGPGRSVSGTDVLWGWADPHQDAVPRDFVFPPGTTTEQEDAANAAQMTDSQQQATAAALTELGIGFTTRTVVAGFATQDNADVFRVGDVVTSVEGKPVTQMSQLPDAVTSSTGDTLEVGIDRNGERSTVTAHVSTLAGHRSLGLYIAPKYAFPFDVTFGIKDIGGPSAGTMMALGIIDQLTRGSLAGDLHVAGTGTITEDGTVGAIGGIPQKVVGARNAGATVFLAPQANCAELSGRVPAGLTVYSVSTLHQARTLLGTLAEGGDTSGLTRCG